MESIVDVSSDSSPSFSSSSSDDFKDGRLLTPFEILGYELDDYRPREDEVCVENRQSEDIPNNDDIIFIPHNDDIIFIPEEEEEDEIIPEEEEEDEIIPEEEEEDGRKKRKIEEVGENPENTMNLPIHSLPPKKRKIAILVGEEILKMLGKGIEIWAPRLKINRVVVEFSSPSIAKEMHVGHLRSTIIGDTLARMFEFSNVTVLRRNHVGDWGIQFGFLIEFLFEKLSHLQDKGCEEELVLEEEAVGLAIGDLKEFYEASRMRFDVDPFFKKKAQQAFLRLQGGEAKYQNAWALICDISRKEFKMVYERLGVVLEEKGESFYNSYIPGVLETFKGLVEDSNGAQVIAIEGQDIPLTLVKSDGGYTDATTDLTALWYRLNEEKAEWIIYVTDVGQAHHFDMVFSAAKCAGWLQANDYMYPKTSHVGFPIQSSEVVRLVDLLDKAKSQSVDALVKRGKASEWTPEELEQTAKAFGYGAVKYANLKINRLTNYTFDFDTGNTAAYLLFAHAHICSVIRESGKDIEELKMTGTIVLDHVDERVLGIHLFQFAEIVEDACTNLLPDALFEYLYNLSEKFRKFYSNCQVNGSPEETRRLLLCEASAIVMRKCFHLLGIEPVYKI